MHPSPERTVVFSEDVNVERRLFDMLEWRGRSEGLEADEGVDPNCFYSSFDCVCQFLLGPSDDHSSRTARILVRCVSPPENATPQQWEHRCCHFRAVIHVVGIGYA